MLLALLLAALGGISLRDIYQRLTWVETIFAFGACAIVGAVLLTFVWKRYSRTGREATKRNHRLRETPQALLDGETPGVRMGFDQELRVPIHLPDSVRARHVHIVGATGSGKTESVILNFLRQDIARGLGAIILDAKGDASFMKTLRDWLPSGERLKVFDLTDPESMPYNPISSGLPLEAAERLFASLVWSEEYYKTKARSALQRLFQVHAEAHNKNPILTELADYLEDSGAFTAATISGDYPQKLAERDFMELSGLRDQIRSLCIGHLGQILSPKDGQQIQLEASSTGTVIYFRLQSLLSPQLVSTVGRLIINHLNYLAGSAHRAGASAQHLIPTYLDEFASFACPEFADLISKARSAKLALHFSHQSVGDLIEVSPGFLSRITDNSATKIILRINDPDSAEFFARSFGTRLYQKVTQRITNAKEIALADVLGEGTQREAHQFRAPPDLFKTLPTGVGSVLIAHGWETPHGASTVFKIQFPKL
jgi:conjugal transfer pilus assembly protein TraD